MSLRLRSRLQALERGVVHAHGCPACCQRRARIALVDIMQTPDGGVVSPDDTPLVCAACGHVPELVVEIVAAVVESQVAASDCVGLVSL